MEGRVMTGRVPSFGTVSAWRRLVFLGPGQPGEPIPRAALLAETGTGMSRQGCLRSPHGDQSCKTKPIRRTDPRRSNTRVGVATETRCAKQSQFPRVHRNGRGRARQPAAPSRKPIVRNKANSRRVPGKVSAFFDKRYDRCGSQRDSAKQSQFLGLPGRARSVRPCFGTGQENRTAGMAIPRRL